MTVSFPPLIKPDERLSWFMAISPAVAGPSAVESRGQKRFSS
jgi:hypothetical protein